MKTINSFFCVILTIVFSLPVFAAGNGRTTVTDAVTYTYKCSDGNVSPQQAKLIAIERAKAEMIEKHFGTSVSQTSTSLLKDEDGRTSSSFFSIGQTEVNGEWIRTIGEPVFEPLRYDNDMLIVTVHIKGEIREFDRAQTQVRIQTLRGGIYDENESEEFKKNDDFFLSCTSPIDGYIAVFIFPFGEDVQRLLPYDSTEGCHKVRGGVREILFVKKNDPRTGKPISEYFMYCDSESQYNKVYVLFSPNRFVHPADEKGEKKDGLEFPNSLSFNAFQTWLSKVRSQDADMVVLEKTILIKN